MSAFPPHGDRQGRNSSFDVVERVYSAIRDRSVARGRRRASHDGRSGPLSKHREQPLTMSDYKSAARASHGEKLKGFAGGGPVAPPASFPIRAPVVSPLSSHPPSLSAAPHPPQVVAPVRANPPQSIPAQPAPQVINQLASGKKLISRASGGRVIRGPAAEREMAQMEKDAKATKNQRHSKKG
jgi:hypothetical protein